MGKFSSFSKNSKQLLALSLAASLALHVGGICLLLKNPFAVLAAAHPATHALTKKQSMALSTTFQNCFSRMIVENHPTGISPKKASKTHQTSALIENVSSLPLSQEMEQAPMTQPLQHSPAIEKVENKRENQEFRLEKTTDRLGPLQCKAESPSFHPLTQLPYSLLSLHQENSAFMKQKNFPFYTSTIPVPTPYLTTDASRFFEPTPSIIPSFIHLKKQKLKPAAVLPQPRAPKKISYRYSFKLPQYEDRIPIIPVAFCPDIIVEAVKNFKTFTFPEPALSKTIASQEMDTRAATPKREELDSHFLSAASLPFNDAIKPQERACPPFAIGSLKKETLIAPQIVNLPLLLTTSFSTTDFCLPEIQTPIPLLTESMHHIEPKSETISRTVIMAPLTPSLDAYNIVHEPPALTFSNAPSIVRLSSINTRGIKVNRRKSSGNLGLNQMANIATHGEAYEPKEEIPSATPCQEAGNRPKPINRQMRIPLITPLSGHQNTVFAMHPVPLEAPTQRDTALTKHFFKRSLTQFKLTGLPGLPSSLLMFYHRLDMQKNALKVLNLCEPYHTSIFTGITACASFESTPQTELFPLSSLRTERLDAEIYANSDQTAIDQLAIAECSCPILKTAPLTHKKYSSQRQQHSLKAICLIPSPEFDDRESANELVAHENPPKKVDTDPLLPIEGQIKDIELAISPTYHQDMNEGGNVDMAQPELITTTISADPSYSIYERRRQNYGNLTAIPSVEELATLSFEEAFDTSVEFNQRQQGGYDFAVTLKPKENLQTFTPSQHMVFVIDSSGTIKKHRYAVFKEGVYNALKYMKSGDTFTILFVDSKIEAYCDTPLEWNKENVRQARHYIEKRPYKGFFTHYTPFDILKKVKSYLSNTKQNVVILITDGRKLDSIKKHRNDLLALEEEHAGKFALFTASACSNNNLGMLDLMSTMHHGEMMYSQTNASFPRKLAVLVKHIENMVAKQVLLNQVGSGNKSLIFASNTKLSPPLYADRPYVVYGHTKTLEDFDLMVQGFNGTQFINVLQHVSFEKAKQGGSKLDRNCDLQRAYICYDRYLQEADLSYLDEADSLLTHRGIPSAVR